MYDSRNILGEEGEEAYSSAVSWTCDSSDSMPDRSCSRDLEIWPSWLFDGRFSDKARWRSSSESLMWSASRNSWGGLVAMMAVVKGGCAQAEVVAVYTVRGAPGAEARRYTRERVYLLLQHHQMYK
jgi:hypothetical protein